MTVLLGVGVCESGDWEGCWVEAGKYTDGIGHGGVEGEVFT